MNALPAMPVARPLVLRVALIWRDEVMEDVLASEAPRRITLGPAGTPTFITPELGLPPEFAIIIPGERGYVLALGPQMRGKVHLDGRTQDVETLADSAVPIGGRDWGVIELDGTGELKLFFQFVAVDPPLNTAIDTFSTLMKSAAGAVFFIMALILFDQVVPIHALGEWLLRGTLLVIVGLAMFGLIYKLVTTTAEMQSSTGFSVLLHGALLCGVIIVGRNLPDPNVWPGDRARTGRALLEWAKPPEPPPVLVQVKASVAAVPQQAAAPKAEAKKPARTATKGAEGASGGKGDKERARDPNAKDVPPEPPKVGMFEDRNRRMLDNIVDRAQGTALGKFAGIKGDTVRPGSIGSGPGAGTGVGPGAGTGTTRGGRGKGPGGGGQVEGDHVTSRGPVDTGKERPGGNCVGPGCKGAGPREVRVALGEMSGDTGGYTADEIQRVVKARYGVFRACYQKELNRSPNIGGTILVKFKIGADGSVQVANVGGGTTLGNDAVQSCITSNVMRLRFPSKGRVANVNYPFLFAPGV